MRRILRIALVLACTATAAATAQQPKAAAKKAAVPADPAELKAIAEKIAKARANLDAALRDHAVSDDLRADASIHLEAGRRMLDLHEATDKTDLATLELMLREGETRAAAVVKSARPYWAGETGSVVRGYVSKVDGSVQPYAVEIPAELDAARPARLDVVLHGRGDALDEARFLRQHAGRKVPADRKEIVLHVFGRGNNAYRWAGETDVFEAIDAVKRNYKVDDDRVVLRGFSMGGAGAWHLGLQHPALWSSVEAGAGFTETLKYAKLDPAKLPPWRLKGISIYESVDYALNAFDVPIIGYGGEVDPQAAASLNIVDALKKLGVAFKQDGLVTIAEGLDFRRVVGKGMGHKVDPASEALMKAFHDAHARTGVNLTPRSIKFVTYTLAYNTAAWLSIERLAEHYRRSTVAADIEGDVVVIKTANVTALGVDRQVGETVKLDGAELPLRLAAKGLLPKVYYRKGLDGWEVLDHDASLAMIEGMDGFKSASVHGPIDDAFRGAFLVVTPTGKAWNPAVDAFARQRLERFQASWAKSMRGVLRIKRDVDVTQEDVEDFHLVLFGDPGSNGILSKVAKGLPVGWTRDSVTLGAGASYPAATSAPLLIAPNPINPRKYVVVNSGHTFEPGDFSGTNALLFPRLGDYAVYRLAEGDKPADVITSGYFNERWRLPSP